MNLLYLRNHLESVAAPNAPLMLRLLRKRTAHGSFFSWPRPPPTVHLAILFGHQALRPRWTRCAAVAHGAALAAQALRAWHPPAGGGDRRPYFVLHCLGISLCCNAGPEAAPDAPRAGGRVVLGSLRRRFAHGIRQLAEVAADRISAMQLRLVLKITALRGSVYAWVPPPPGDRLWFSFTEPPELVATAAPMVGGRLLKYSAQVTP